MIEREDLPDIFFTELDTFRNIHDPNVSGTIIMYELLNEIKYNISVDDLLTKKYVDNRKNPIYDKIKSKKTAVCYNATYNSYKKGVNLKSITKLMFLDYDGFNTKHEAECFKNYLINNYDWVVSCNLSLSRLGLHIIIWVDDIIDSKDYNLKYDFINKTYFNGKLDSNAKSLTQYTVIPFDYNIFINYNPTRLNVSELIKKENLITKKVLCVKKFTSNNSDQFYQNDAGINAHEKVSCGKEEKRKIINTPYNFY